MPLSEFEIFDQARQIESDSERLRFLVENCADENQRRRIEELLKANNDESFLNSPTLDFQEIERLEDRSGEIIDAYKLVKQIGRGGMGVVYLAQQLEPINRRVAVKLIRVDSPISQVIPRFESERQALAMMEHPNIARFYDAGTTSRGNPYFVMEYVDGISLIKYCDKHQLTIIDRLRLFGKICRAVSHAHSKGIVHRDLKPANILVANIDDVPTPKVIDFGLAKSEGTLLNHDTVHTDFGQFLGTLAYMSPEQTESSSKNIDVRSDVYSLGIILYELLVGGPPFAVKNLKKAALIEVVRIIRELDPPSPVSSIANSDSNSEIAQNRQLNVEQLQRMVRGDLEWIVMRSLEKEPGRRYQSASDLAKDIQRFIEHEPVTARPPSIVYKTRKFVQRNQTALMVTALTSVALFVGIWLAILLRTNGSVGLDLQLAKVEKLVDEKKVEAANQMLQVLRREYPDNPFVFVLLSRIDRLNQEIDNQLEDLDEAIRLNPEFFDARLERGLALQQIDPPELNKALRDLKMAVELRPHDSVATDQLNLLGQKIPAVSEVGETVIASARLDGTPVMYSFRPDGLQTKVINVAPKEDGPRLIRSEGLFSIVLEDGRESAKMVASHDGAAVTRDGKTIVFADRSNKESYKLVRMTFDGKQKTTLLDGRWVFTPVFSPDETKVAFMIHEEEDFEIATINLDGTGFKLLTKVPGRDGGLHKGAWDKNGKRLVFQSERKSQPRRTYLLDLETGKTVELGIGSSPSWAYVDERGNFLPRHILHMDFRL